MAHHLETDGQSAFEPRPVDPAAGFGRRRLLQLGAAGLGAAALAACSGPTTGKSSAGSTAGEKVDYSGVKPASTIQLWSDHPGSSAKLETQLVNEYNASQSETKVQLVTAGSNYADIAQKFQTALASNNVPALVMVSDVWWFRYVLNGETIPVDPIAKAVGIDTSDYVDTFYEDYLYNGQHWAIPYARSTPVFYYNKAHFKAAGLPDRAPKTWEEFEGFAKKLQAQNLGTKAVYNWTTPVNYLSWTYENIVWGWGGDYSTKWDLAPVDGSGMLDSLKWAATTMQSNGGWAGMTSNNQSDDLAAGTVSTTVDSTGAIGKLMNNSHFEIGAGFVPGGPKAADHVCPTGGAGIAISKKSGAAEQLAGAKFLKWLTNPANTVRFAAYTGYLPVRKSAKTSSLTKKTPLIQVALDQLDHLRSQAWARVFITGGGLDIGQGIGQVLLKNADPKSTMENVKNQLSTIYDRDIKPSLPGQ